MKKILYRKIRKWLTSYGYTLQEAEKIIAINEEHIKIIYYLWEYYWTPKVEKNKIKK